MIGVDSNAPLLLETGDRQLPGADFRLDDLRTFADPQIAADGIGCKAVLDSGAISDSAFQEIRAGVLSRA